MGVKNGVKQSDSLLQKRLNERQEKIIQKMLREEKGEISDDTDKEVLADYKQHEMDKELEEQFDKE